MYEGDPGIKKVKRSVEKSILKRMRDSVQVRVAELTSEEYVVFFEFNGV